jgi:excisionase family DNA binding protein
VSVTQLELLTIEEMGERIRVSPRWIEERMEEGLPSIKKGRLRRFRPEKVIDWLEREGQA